MISTYELGEWRTVDGVRRRAVGRASVRVYEMARPPCRNQGDPLRTPAQNRGNRDWNAYTGEPKKCLCEITDEPKRDCNQTKPVPSKHGSLTLVFGPYRVNRRGKPKVDVECVCGSSRTYDASAWRARKADKCSTCVKRGRVPRTSERVFP